MGGLAGGWPDRWMTWQVGGLAGGWVAWQVDVLSGRWPGKQVIHTEVCCCAEKEHSYINI